jgi:Protein of unknown function (DUF2924)
MPDRQNDSSKEALSRLPTLNLAELRELWCHLYKSEASPRLSRELLVRAVAYRMQEAPRAGRAWSCSVGSASSHWSCSKTDGSGYACG